MKKMILGAVLMLIGTIAYCTHYLSHQILFAAPDVAVIGENFALSYGGIIALVVGVILCASELISDR